MDNSYNVMELEFFDDGSTAYIWGAQADANTLVVLGIIAGGNIRKILMGKAFICVV